jgi:predicted type IV restriction endonuclease
MAGGDVKDYVKRSESLLETSSQMNENDVGLKLIRPLIEMLGWDSYTDLQSEYSVRAGTTQLRIDYALLEESTPAVLIEAKGAAVSLNEDHREQLANYMRQTGVEWGLLTNGRSFQVLRLTSEGTTSMQDTLVEIQLEEMTQDWDIMNVLSKEMVVSGDAHQLADQLDTRKQGIRELQRNKDNLADQLTETLVEQAGDILQHEIEVEVTEFVDDLIQSLQAEPSDSEFPTTADEILDKVGTVLPGRKEEQRQKRAEIVLSLYKFLRKQERVDKDGMQQHLSNKRPNEFDKDEFERHWVNYARDTLAELPRVEQPVRGATQIWRYVPPKLDEKISVGEIDEWILNLESIVAKDVESAARQRAMVQRAHDYLQENERATKDELEEVLPPYTAHYIDFEGFWSSCLKEAFNASDDLYKPTRSHQYWYYTGGNGEKSQLKLDIEIEDWVLKQDISGQDRTIQQRQSLLQFAYEYLQQVETAKRYNFEEYFRENIPGNTGQYRNFDGLWSYLIKDGLKQAPGVDVIQSGKSGPTTYEYRNTDSDNR